jgi:hypothetical protein
MLSGTVLIVLNIIMLSVAILNIVMLNITGQVKLAWASLKL